MDAFDPKSPEDSPDEELWQLLGRARRVEASPYFARKVLRAIEEEEPVAPSWWQIILRTVAPAAVCAGIAIVAMVGIPGKDAPQVASSTDLEFDTIENLDLLVSNYESSIWLDHSSSSR